MRAAHILLTWTLMIETLLVVAKPAALEICSTNCVPAPRPYHRPNCGCVALGACSGEAGLYTREVLHKSDMVCGLRFETCCYEGVWPGVEDDFARAAQCIPHEQCVRPYGILPTDVSEFGIIAPCPGYGAVRCILAGNGGGFVAGLPAPSSVVIPIVGTETSGGMMIGATAGQGHSSTSTFVNPAPAPIAPASYQAPAPIAPAASPAPAPIVPASYPAPVAPAASPAPAPIAPAAYPVPVPTPVYVQDDLVFGATDLDLDTMEDMDTAVSTADILMAVTTDEDSDTPTVVTDTTVKNLPSP